MIDLTTIQTFEVLQSLSELQEKNLLLIAKNKQLNGWIIGGGIAIGIGIVFVTVSKIRNNGKAKEQAP